MIQKLFAALTLLVVLNGCTTLTSAVTEDPITTDPEGRTMGEVIDDKNTRTRLAVNLEKYDERYKEANVDIYVNAGVVLIVGQVPTAEMVQRATELLSSDTQVQAIHNHLTAEPNIKTSLASSDKWLGVKVRSRMFSADNFSSSNIDVIVQKGVVYIMGRVTEETADRAVQIASEVNGVQKVVKVFQIIP
ncbi:BON domain-containing protein [Reinekea marinisedimentorum]|uniref:Osmotically-inducible protein OsmY n=1 Tax=Reinekea marinisedimentorum TaxID=230495 RepID=A0A4R3I8T3_9GAMM|nr:BON domain-containing protein [Reinekea marinisedimentorum]TCS41732.1 osmotically-inducible protein OsmY [Reinekea marinisedimentorum]